MHCLNWFFRINNHRNQVCSVMFVEEILRWDGTSENIRKSVIYFFWFLVGDFNIKDIFFFKALAVWANSFYKSKCPPVCPSVRLCVCSLFEVTFKRIFTPNSLNLIPKILEIPNPWKSSGKKLSQIWTFLLKNGLKSLRQKKFFTD